MDGIETFFTPAFVEKLPSRKITNEKLISIKITKTIVILT